MKTIVSNGISLYKFDDDCKIVSNHVGIVISQNGTEILKIFDLNFFNSTVYDDVNIPADWFGQKYRFDGTTWTVDPDWSDPNPPE